MFGKIYAAKAGQSLLCWPHQEELGIKLDPRADPPVYSIEAPNDIMWYELCERF